MNKEQILYKKQKQILYKEEILYEEENVKIIYDGLNILIKNNTLDEVSTVKYSDTCKYLFKPKLNYIPSDNISKMLCSITEDVLNFLSIQRTLKKDKDIKDYDFFW